MPRKETKVYTLMNVCSAKLLLAKAGGYYRNTGNPRNYTIGQFNFYDRQVLEQLIGSSIASLPTPTSTSYNNFVPEVIWVKKSKIQDLYAAVACSVFSNRFNIFSRTRRDKLENQLIGAFLLSLGTDKLLDSDVVTFAKFYSFLRKQKLGKEFLTFLDKHDMLFYYAFDNQTKVSFKMVELELVEKNLSEIDTNFAGYVAAQAITV